MIALMYRRVARVAADRRAGGLLLAAVVAGLLLAACGGGGSSGEPATSAPASGPGTITVSSSTISGQQGKLLLIYAEAADKPGYIAQACVQITSNSFQAPATALVDFKQGDNPCSGSPAQTRFPEGNYNITAGVLQPPAQSLEKKVTQAAHVAGNTKISLDGGGLSK